MAYTKTNWVNGETPINATNLNKIENQLEANDTATSTNTDNIGTNTTNISTLGNRLDDMFYKDGDTFSANSDYYVFAGMVTGGGKNIRFTIPLPKSAANISSVTLESLTLTVRGVGGYVPAATTDFLTNSNTASYNARVSNNLLAVEIIGTNAWSNVTNNTPVAVTCNGLSATFNE